MGFGFFVGIQTAVVTPFVSACFLNLTDFAAVRARKERGRDYTVVVLFLFSVPHCDERAAAMADQSIGLINSKSGFTAQIIRTTKRAVFGQGVYDPKHALSRISR